MMYYHPKRFISPIARTTLHTSTRMNTIGVIYSGRIFASAVLVWSCCVVLTCNPVPSVSKAPGPRSPASTEAEPEHDDPALAKSELKGLFHNGTAPDSVPRPLPSAAPPSTVSFRFVQGYRVQVFSVRDRNAALAAKRETQQRLTDFPGIGVYIDGDPPFYKVRIGDFLTRTEAEKLAALLRSKKGYTEAWVVETLVHPPSDDPLPQR